MKKLIALIAILALIGIHSPVFAMGGGEGSNTGCNGEGNENSPCTGNTNNGGNGGNIGNITNTNRNTNNNFNRARANSRSNSTSKASVKNKVSNEQNQSANNEGINIGGNSYKSTYVEAVQTIPLVGTTSAGINTPMGGGSFSVDSAYAKIKFKMDQTEVAFKRGYITDEERLKEGKKLYKQLLKANKKGLISNIVDPLF